MTTIEFKGEKYKLQSEEEDIIVFKKIDEFEEYSLQNLASEYAELQDEYEYAEEEASNYQERVDEFRYCGYNEEDPDFHGMCLHQNGLDEEVRKIEERQFKVLGEIEKRLNNDSTEIMCLLNEYGVNY